MAIFLIFFFLGNTGKENLVYYIPKRKNAFLGYKNKKFKSRKIDIFPKGLTPMVFVQKGQFFNFFLGNIG